MDVKDAPLKATFSETRLEPIIITTLGSAVQDLA